MSRATAIASASLPIIRAGGWRTGGAVKTAASSVVEARFKGFAGMGLIRFGSEFNSKVSSKRDAAG
jgi:hypothetical protein